jgi:putative FmdB family regulatory protein
MPIYRYRCSECGAQEEHLQKLSDPPMDTCATCGGPLTKQMTAAAFHLKGGGWYKDLYASSKPDSGGKSEAASSDSGGSSSGGSDSGGSDSSGSSSGGSDSGSSSASSSSSSGSSSSTGSSSSASSSAA